jgi:hypothetical protein
MSELWLPGGALDIDDFVRRVHQQIARFAEEQGLVQATVEVELRDGARHVLDDERQELIVPLASVAQLRISAAEKNPQFGFALPDAPD